MTVRICSVEPSPEQEAAVDDLLNRALESASDVTVAAELLMGAAATLLITSYMPAAAINIMDLVMDGVRQAVREAIN